MFCIRRTQKKQLKGENDMDNKIYVSDWNYAGNRVRLIFRDGSEYFISKDKFESSTNLIFSATKDEIKRDITAA